MPTSNTYAVMEGCSFEEFVWRCVGSHAKTLDVDRETRWYRNIVDEHASHVAELEVMTDEQVLDMLKTLRREALERSHAAEKENARDNERLMAMATRVEQWTPPSAMHEGHKIRMLRELRDSMRPSKPYEYVEPTLADVATYREERATWLQEEREVLAKREASIERHNAWLSALEDSVERPEKAEP